MLLALVATALVAVALLSEELLPRIEEMWTRHRARRQMAPVMPYDPGRERRAGRNPVERASFGFALRGFLGLLDLVPLGEHLIGRIDAGLIADVAPGLTFLAFHSNHAGDIDVLDPPRARCRISEAHLLQDAAFVTDALEQDLVLVGFRDIRDRLRKQGTL